MSVEDACLLEGMLQRVSLERMFLLGRGMSAEDDVCEGDVCECVYVCGGGYVCRRCLPVDQMCLHGVYDEGGGVSEEEMCLLGRGCL